MIFYSPTVNVPSDSDIEIGKKIIKRLQFVKSLGLMLDELLSWRRPLNELSKKLARTCETYFLNGKLLPLNVLLCLYHALFLSFLQMALSHGGEIYAFYIDQIFQIAKKAVSAISLGPRMSPSIPTFNDHKLLKISNIFELRLLNFILDSVAKLLQAAFLNYSYLVYLFINRPHDRPAKVASIGPDK